MVAGEDNEGAQASGHARPQSAEPRRDPSGLTAGDLVDRPRPGRPAGRRRRSSRQMKLPRLATRHSRAVLLLTVLRGRGRRSPAASAAEQHLSAAGVPAHRRHRARRHDAGAVDDADGRAADRAGGHGSAGHPARAVAHVPRRHRNLRAVRPGDGHGRRAAAGAGAHRRDSRRAARGARPHGRSAHAGRVSDLQPQPHRRPVGGRSARLRLLRRPAGARARRRRRPRRGAVERHARNRGHRRSRRSSPARA